MIKKIATHMLLMLSALGCLTATHAATLDIQQGVVVGKRSNGVDAYLGVPYAAPPLGANRWRMPQPPSPWRGKRLATQFADSCQQETSTGFGPYTKEYMVPGSVSEDCLYLNIWRPTSTKNQKLPIIVWIPGGGFTTGSGSVPVYDGSSMAAQGVVVVNVNYRLGVFGFLAHPELSQQGDGAGNYGFADIIAALKWVNDNAQALGGDEGNITIAGQSAGSMAIHDLMASPAAKNLFAKAISESGPGMGRPPVTLATAESTGKELLGAAGVESITQLRELPAETVMKAEAKLGPRLLRFAPVIDGHLLPHDPYDNTRGQYFDTPLLAGMNADEAFTLPADDHHRLDADVQALFGGMASQAKAFYATEATKDAAALNKTIRRERGMASTLLWATSRAHSSAHATYLYLFDHVEPGTEQWGAFHTSEVPYAFVTLDHSTQRTFTDKDRAVGRQVSSYWLNFVKNGNPNSPTLPKWAVFDPQAPAFMVLSATSGMKPMLTPETLQFYKSLMAQGVQLSLF
jgi:para-nitrobenzyl esterase